VSQRSDGVRPIPALAGRRRRRHGAQLLDVVDLAAAALAAAHDASAV
tara:strand:+ start:343 stop:483 length:141 start_codon:yes stop_codon:yes gene_type:complete